MFCLHEDQSMVYLKLTQVSIVVVLVGQLKPWLIPRSENLSSLLVGDLIRRGQRVLCIMSPDLALEGLPMWESSTIYNTYANTPTLDQMVCVT